MCDLMGTSTGLRRGLVVLSALTTAGLLALAAGPSAAAPPKKGPAAANSATAAVRTAPAVPPSSLLSSDAWRQAPLTVARPEEIDAIVAREWQASGLEPAPLTTDEQFLRRVTLDLTGQLPLPADVTEFAADPDPAKRAKLIDKLLASDEYARHWAGYWRDVLAARLPDARSKLLIRPFEEWITDQLRQDRRWDAVVRAMLTAEGPCRFEEGGKHGENFFLASHRGPDAANEQAAETARIFLGIQVQCAQCHDHPFDQWKRVQFHELAAYFARLAERPLREDKRVVGAELVSRPRGEHQMPSKEDPKKGTLVTPRFLDGRAPAANLPDLKRRQALADAVVDPNNYWFAGAYVNRLWGELMGQSFYEPVDDMGPRKEAVLAPVLVRLSSSFRASRYDVKGLFRLILNTQTYQRQLRPGDASEGHLHFAAACPTRLPADALWESLVGVLGNLGGPVKIRPGPVAAAAGLRPGLEGAFLQEFNFDPSQKRDEVEGSVPQALLMMNNPVLNNRIRATGSNLLARILKAYPQDDDALRMLYLRTLARKPTDREMQKCRAYVEKASNRAEAFEDVLWALLNSTEFQTKR
jgi:hypothetical protein